jgi:hypothetical protein
MTISLELRKKMLEILDQFMSGTHEVVFKIDRLKMTVSSKLPINRLQVHYLLYEAVGILKSLVNNQDRVKVSDDELRSIKEDCYLIDFRIKDGSIEVESHAPINVTYVLLRSSLEALEENMIRSFFKTQEGGCKKCVN